MVLLTKLKYKEAIALDGGIREATAVLLTRLRILSVCVEGSLGQNGLFGAMITDYRLQIFSKPKEKREKTNEAREATKGIQARPAGRQVLCIEWLQASVCMCVPGTWYKTESENSL